MFTLITDTNEYTLNTIEEVVAKANALANNQLTSFDLECEEKNIYFGFMTKGQVTVKQMKEWIEEETEQKGVDNNFFLWYTKDTKGKRGNSHDERISSNACMYNR